MVLVGAAAILIILKIRDELSFAEQHTARKKNIIDDIYRDLVKLFYILKPGQFLGPLEPLNNTEVLKNLVMVEDNESFTINKKVIHLCTKDPGSGKYYDKNTLMFVVLHELAHVLCNDVGHTDNFSKINQALLDHAIKHKFYDPTKPFIKNYCSV
ncbi:metallopeptidase [Chloriridovirus anopheles1]|uniref:Metallopeptidase n=1 Tax=Chloriridovirus anopheles1 TaxID=1465751 RepID=W8QRH0_9VIRU|nr:metallopeptidase [Anopheles minimus iridovirus]AHL67587.1 metallopeptidase [Anopheles minimus iridovirus]